jgi:ElaB/YqjD/DUF883 family membrane-anchored ribosome-binding protein
MAEQSIVPDVGAEPPVDIVDTTHSAGLREQASAKAHELASKGKEKATDLLEQLTGLTDDLSTKVKERLGDNYGSYVGDIAGKVAGIATSLKEKDVGELADDAREFVRKRPVVAIGAAAAIGFVIARLVKSGTGSSGDADA